MIWGVPPEPVWCHLGEPYGERKALFSLKAPRRVPGRDFEPIWSGFGEVFLDVFLDLLSMVFLLCSSSVFDMGDV